MDTDQNIDHMDRERVRVLRDYGVLDTPEDPVFDDITALASMICQTPISLISLVDENRQWFKSHRGLETRQLPRNISFCTHTIRRPDEVMIVGDATRDPRFAQNPLVTSDTSIRFYAGAPLITPDGFALGTVCVIDRVPRHLSQAQLSALRSLARQAMSQLELRRALRAEREIEEQYRRLFAANPMPMWVYDRESLAILAINDAAIAQYGLSQEELPLLNALELYPTYEHERMKQFSAAPLPIEYPRSRWRHKRKDGTEMSVDVFVHEIRFAGRSARIVQALDRTEEERAIAALKASEQRFESVARAVSDVIWDLDVTTGAVWWSEGLQTLFGYPAGTKPQSVEHWGMHIHPGERDRVMRELQQALASTRTEWSDEYRFKRHDGTYAFVQDRGQILRDAEGRAYRMIGGISDLTERKLLEAQYLRAQRMESIGSLAGGIAHDLNNVLTPILVSINLLQAQFGHDKDALERLNIIEASANRGAALIRQVLSFARGTEGIHVPVTIGTVLAEAVRLARETFPRSITFKVDVPQGTWPLSADATHLHQVFMNLLVNARDAMPQGGVLEIRARNADLPAAEAAPFKKKGGPYVIVAVRDTGTGIPPEIIDRIFDPFFTTKEHGAGTGLGLATVHGITAGHGGFVRVFSEMGEGTTFEVCLPAATAQAVAPLEARAAPPRGKGELILVVDDEIAVRTIAAQTLELFGYRVLSAENGLEALSIFRVHGADIRLVVTDMMMPVLDGGALVTELHTIHPELPIVLASGGRQYGADAPPAKGIYCLNKPYTAGTLLTTVRQALDAAPKD